MDSSVHLISSLYGFKTTQHTARVKAIIEGVKQLSFDSFGMAFVMILLITIRPLSFESQRLEYALITWADSFHSLIFSLAAFDLISEISKILNKEFFISFDNEPRR